MNCTQVSVVQCTFYTYSPGNSPGAAAPALQRLQSWWGQRARRTS